jgi:hypothetical protein
MPLFINKESFDSDRPTDGPWRRSSVPASEIRSDLQWLNRDTESGRIAAGEQKVQNCEIPASIS